MARSSAISAGASRRAWTTSSTTPRMMRSTSTPTSRARATAQIVRPAERDVLKRRAPASAPVSAGRPWGVRPISTTPGSTPR